MRPPIVVVDREKSVTDQAFELAGVTKRFRTVTAVDRLSFAVDRQEIFALLGPNGAGKTTTVRMVQGILAPDEGSISFGVEGVRGHCRPGLGYLPEDRGLYRDQSIGRILEIFGRVRGMSRSDARTETGRWLERFDLADRSEDKLETLSKGNQQKVQFAAAILHRPALAILDEPFSGLDPLNQDVFLDLLRELRDAGMTIVLSAHQMDLVERVADRLLILGGGRKLLEGTVDELRQRSSDGARVVVRLSDPANAPPVADDPVVASVTERPDGSLEVAARSSRSLADLLASVSSWAGLSEVTSTQQRLHEIYVDVVASCSASGGDGDTGESSGRIGEGE